MSETESFCDNPFINYSREWYLPKCYFGYVILPQFFIKPSKPTPCIGDVVTNQPYPLQEEGTKIESQGQPSCIHIEDIGGELHTNQPPSLQEEGTKIESQGQSSSIHIEDIGVELQTNQPYSLQAPEIVLFPRKDEEALDKKLKNMTRHEQNLLILKNFLKVIPEEKGGYDGVFFATSFPSRANVEKVENMVKKMATRLACISLREWMLNVSKYLGLEVTNSNSDKAFEEPLFKSVALFILHMFDREDFERFNCCDKLTSECTKFWKEMIPNLKSENPYKFVAERKINLDGFPSLREQDLGYILSSVFDFVKFGHVDMEVGVGLQGSTSHELRDCIDAEVGVVLLMDFGWPHYVSCFFKEECHNRFEEMARTVLLQYLHMKDLKEDVKMYSILGRGSTLDVICDEALSNIDLIFELGKCDEILAQSFKDFLASMIKRKYSIMKFHCSYATHVLWSHKLGLFGKDVRNLVEIADLRRRFLSERFISKRHILWAINLTEFKDFVDRLVKDIGLMDSVEIATCPPYSIYISARISADIHGAEVVGVEHIMVATIFEMSQKKLRKNLNEFNNMRCVKIFIEAVVDYKRKYDDQRRLDELKAKEHALDDQLDGQFSDIFLNDEDNEGDVDIYLDDYFLEYINKNKMKNMSKKYKCCKLRKYLW